MNQNQLFMKDFLSSKQEKMIEKPFINEFESSPKRSNNSLKSFQNPIGFQKIPVNDEPKPTTERIELIKKPLEKEKPMVNHAINENTKNLMNRFIQYLKESSKLKKIPNEMKKKDFILFGDQTFIFKKNEEINKKSKSNSFSCFKRFIKNFWKSEFLIIHPHQNFKIFWDFIQLLIMIFLFFYLPLDIVFVLDNSITIRNLLAPLMIFDNCLGFTTAYFLHGILIKDRKKIIKNYGLNFALDLLVQFSLNSDCFFRNYDSKIIEIRFVKLLIFVEYRKFSQKYQTIIDRFKIDMKCGCFLDFCHLIMTSICVMHWVACAWYFVGDYFGEEQNWLIATHLVGKTNFQKYIHSLYWCAITMMTVGYGDIGPKNIIEIIFVIFVVVLGCGLSAYYIRYFL